MIQSIFISSSGDLKALRRGLYDDLLGWLDQHGFAHLLKPYLWEEDKENGRLLSDRQRIQSQFPDPASQEVAMTICLFGERCGSPLEDEIDPLVSGRFDRWRAKGDEPGLLHPWPRDREGQDRALALGQYPLTGTVFELLSAHAKPEVHARPELADDLIVACAIDRPVMAETTAESVVLNARKLHAFLTTGRSDSEVRSVNAEIYDPQIRALLNLLKDHARKLRFVTNYPSEEAMRRGVFAIAQEKLRRKLGIASLNNPFKQNLAHWTVHDKQRLLGRSDAIRDIVAMAKPGDLVLLEGRSGCGKSSLMQCGVMNRLREIDGSITVPFRPNELMAGSGEGDALERLARLIAETVGAPFPAGGPVAMRPENYGKRLKTAIEHNGINLVLGLDQFEEIIDELKLERERSTGAPQSGWWLVIRFLKALCASPRIRLIATLESARETSFQNLRIGEAIGLTPKMVNVDATHDTVGEIAKNGFLRGGLELDPAVVEAIKSQWRAFERDTSRNNASPLPLACLFFHRLYEKFAEQAGAAADERLGSAFRHAGSRDGPYLLTLEEIGGQGALAFADIIQNLADEAWRTGGGGEPTFADPIETGDGFVGLNNFLKPFWAVDQDGLLQPRAAIEIDANVSTRRMRKAFRERRLLAPLPGDGPQRLQPVHQALVDRWSPARRWLAHRKQNLQIVQRFREDAAYWLRRGQSMPLDSDGSTLQAAALTLYEHLLDWQLSKSGAVEPHNASLWGQALAVFDTAENPFTIIEGTPTRITYGLLAAYYHRVDLLRRFIAVDAECLKAQDQNGNVMLHAAAWSDGPAVRFLIEKGAPLKTEKGPANAILIPIYESLNNNFDAMANLVGLNEKIDSASKGGMIHFAVQQGNLHVINYLIDHHAALDAQDTNQQTAMHWAAQNDQVDAFLRLLPYIDIQKENFWGSTAISVAALYGATKILSAYLNEERDLARLGAVLHQRHHFGDTPLMVAARRREPEALRVLMQAELGELGDPSTTAHRGPDGDTAFHAVLRGVLGETPTEAEGFRARAVVEILLGDGRLDPNLRNDKGEAPLDIPGIHRAFAGARRALRRDPRVPKDYASMNGDTRIEDLSSRRPSIVLALLEEAPQALMDEHKPMSGLPGVSTPLNGEPLAAAETPGETGLDILIRLKNHAVLAVLADQEAHWSGLRQEFLRLLPVAAVSSADRLRAVLLHRFANGEIEASDAGKLLGASIEAEDFQTARALIELGAPLTLNRDGEGQTILHGTAISGAVDRFRSVLALGRFARPLDDWGRRPSDLAAETLAATLRAMEAGMDEPIEGTPSLAAPLAIAGPPPFLSLEGQARAPDEVEMATLRREWDEAWGNIDAVDIHLFDPVFYPDRPLVVASPRSPSASRGRLYFIIQGNKLHKLGGASAPIHELNSKEKPLIDEATALHYLAFFCFFVRGSEGPFLIVDRPQNGFLPDLGERKAELGDIFRPPRVWGRSERGDWRVSALVYYADAVFLADFNVQPDGMIVMIDDTPVLAELRARIDAPLEIRSLH